MFDETDVSKEKGWFYAERAKTVIANLQRRKINAQYVPSRAEALAAVLEMIPKGAKVVRGDSVSVDQIGIIPALMKNNRNEVLDPFERDEKGYLVVDDQEKNRRARAAFSADVFLAGTNAVTLDGKLVNIDGLGNRVAAMIYGPEKVILVIGANKIVKNVDEALERIHNCCTPVNATRHVVKHHRVEFAELPCARTGKCVDCSHEWRICNFTVIIEGTMIYQKGRINVVLVGEELGI